MAKEQRRAIQCTLQHHLGKLRESEKGWCREVNVISWEGAASRLDIRDWSRNKERSSKGLTFTRAEVEQLREILSILNTSIIEDTGMRLRLQDVRVSYQEKTQVDSNHETVQQQEQSEEIKLELDEELEEQRAVI